MILSFIPGEICYNKERTSRKEGRNLMIHDYTGIDLRIVGDTVEQDLPHLKQRLEEILGNP